MSDRLTFRPEDVSLVKNATREASSALGNLEAMLGAKDAKVDEELEAVRMELWMVWDAVTRPREYGAAVTRP